MNVNRRNLIVFTCLLLILILTGISISAPSDNNVFNTSNLSYEKLSVKIDNLEKKGKFGLFAAGILGAWLVMMQLYRGSSKSSGASAGLDPDFTQHDDKDSAKESLSTVSDVIRTRRLEIVDAQGKVCATLSAGKDSNPSLKIFDKYGVARIDVSIDEDGIPGVGIFDIEGSERIWMMVDNENTPLIDLYDNNAQVRMEIAVDEETGSRLDIYNTDGTAVAELGEDGGHQAKLAFWDADEHARITLSTDAEGSPSLILNHSDDRAYASISMDTNGQPEISLVNNNADIVFTTQENKA